MNYNDWRPIHRNTQMYLHDLEAFVQEFIPWSILSGYQPELLLPAPFDEGLIAKAAERIARRMITGVAVTNARSWREAALRSLQGRRIAFGLQAEMRGVVGLRVNELIQKNAKLIQGLPEYLAQRVTAYVAREQRAGTRSAAIAKALHEKLPGFAKSRVKLIARTEVGKAESAITEARSEKLGLHWYEWATSEDQRVRPGHRKLATVLVAWSDPPAPEALAGETSQGHYHPGCIYNCRCLSLPLVSLDEVRWPHKLYHHGRIDYVGRAEFERWNRIDQAA